MILCLAWGVNANTAIVYIIIYYKLILLPPDLCEQEGCQEIGSICQAELFHFFICLQNCVSKQLIFISLSELIVFCQITVKRKEFIIHLLSRLC